MLLNCLPEVKPNEKEHGGGGELEREVDVDGGGEVWPGGVL